MNRLLAACLPLGLFAVAGCPAVAHHSMSAYEFFATTMEGTVQEFKYTNPHCILVLKAGSVVWHLEGDAPAMMDRAGFGPNTFRPGDQLKVEVQRLKNGKPGGFWTIRTVIMQNGHEFVGHQCVSSHDSCNPP